MPHTVSPLRAMIHRSIPRHINNPLSLAMRIVASRNGEAFYALGSAALQVAVTPLDLALSVRERRLYDRAPLPERPIVFVVGPPRSGTTVAAQVLSAGLPVAYFNNLTSIFPRSPITVNRMVRAAVPQRPHRVSQFLRQEQKLVWAQRCALFLGPMVRTRPDGDTDRH